MKDLNFWLKASSQSVDLSRVFMRLTIVSKFYRDIPEFRDVLISWMKSQARNVGYVFCNESGLKIEFFLWYMLRT